MEGLTAVVGLNGAGKTTLLRLLAGDLRPQQGQVELTPGTTVLPQGARLRSRARLRDALGYIAALRGVARSRRADAVATVMDLCRIDDGHAAARVDDLSAGWRQRALIAQTLLGTPTVVLLDEPTSALDVGASRDLWQSFCALAAHTPMVVATHEASAALEFSDQLIAVRDGCVDTPRTGADLRARWSAHGGTPEQFLLETLRDPGGP